MNTSTKVLLVFGVIVIAVLCALSYTLDWFGWSSGNVQNVVQHEVAPTAALGKYMWFVDQSNAIKQADANIVVYQARLAGVDKHYTDEYGTDKTKWAESAQVMYNHDWTIAHDDLTSVINMRNTAVRDYNAQSQKFNWALFKSRDDLPPQTYTELPLP